MLVAKGANPAIQGGDYGPAAMLTACGGHVGVVRHLVGLELAPLVQAVKGQQLGGEVIQYSDELEFQSKR